MLISFGFPLLRNAHLSPTTFDSFKDLHQFSAPMSKIAVRHVIESLLMGKAVHDVAKDLVIVVGKGKGSENGIRVLMPKVKSMLFEEYGVFVL